MRLDPLTIATDKIRELTMRKVRPLSSLEAVFQVTEGMSQEDATQVLRSLIEQRYLCQMDADLAQMLATKLGVEVQWSHMPLVPGAEWQEGRG